ncbi:MAG: hypothetical protein GC150_11870 [Rhizobiales bacterium]|nr:hypothetical protein [Hyphomicrobiales bacterium]
MTRTVSMLGNLTMRAVLGAGLPLTAMILYAGAAQASGSVTFQEVARLIAKNPALEREVRQHIEATQLGYEAIVCDGTRLGRHWVHLGGRRIAPYTCTLGDRLLNLEADAVYVDAAGTVLDDPGERPARAVVVEEYNPRGAWAPR